MAVDPSGKFVYVTNHLADNVSAFSITATSGALTQIPGSPFPSGNTPFNVAVDPSGKFVYVTNHLSGDVTAYTLNAASGALTQITGSPFTSGSQPHGVVVDPRESSCTWPTTVLPAFPPTASMPAAGR